jgi:hypothetical protein
VWVPHPRMHTCRTEMSVADAEVGKDMREGSADGAGEVECCYVGEWLAGGVGE